MDEHASPHAIIKALKSGTGLKTEDGTLKIAIAANAWTSKSHFPNKDEVLADWLLSTIAKERTNVK